MAQKDWIEIIKKFNTKDKSFIQNFLNSRDSFCPSENHLNILMKKIPIIILTLKIYKNQILQSGYQSIKEKDLQHIC